MKQNPFESEFAKSLKRIKKKTCSFAWRRFYDTKTFRQLSEKIICIKQPGDFFALHKGVYYLFELKSSKNAVSYSINFIQDHQIDSLKEFREAGGKSYLIICDRSTPRHYKAYVISMFNYMLLTKHLVENNRKSIRWTDMDKFAFQIERLPEGLWALESIFSL